NHIVATALEKGAECQQLELLNVSRGNRRRNLSDQVGKCRTHGPTEIRQTSPLPILQRPHFLHRLKLPHARASAVKAFPRYTQKQAVISDKRWCGFEQDGGREHHLVANAGPRQGLLRRLWDVFRNFVLQPFQVKATDGGG